MSEQQQAARRQALRYLSLRGYGERELYDKLCQNHEEPDAAAAVAHMADCGYLNDAQYAENRAKGMAERGKSRREIARKLASLGLDGEVIDAALAAAGPDDAENALALLQKQYMDKLRAGKRENVMAALARRGFGYRDIRDAVEQAMEQLDDDYDCEGE